MTAIVAVIACVLTAVVVVQHIVNEEIRILLHRLRMLNKNVEGFDSRIDILEKQCRDHHTKLETDYFNHMRDMNELNKRMMKIERRLENENH